jgi:GLPGLI family protein
MKAKSFLLLISLILFGKTSAQIQIAYAMDDPSLLITHKDISKYQVLDTSFLQVTYNLSFIPDTLNRSNILEDELTLQIGRNISKCFSKTVLETDSACAAEEKAGKELSMNDEGAQGYEIFKYNSGKDLRVTNRLPYSDLIYEYSEEIPSIKWIMLPDTCELQGYKCQKAEAFFKGRKYLAWFTFEIPVMNGPWKLGGLPGLILNVSDSDNQYRFECIGLIKAMEPIKLYSWKPKRITLAQWNKLESTIHRRAGDYVSSNNVRVLIFENGKVKPVPTDWQEPFNSIER